MHILKEFTDLGNSASYHFADDSGKEWDAAYAAQHKAESLFIQHPELRDEMIAIAKKFLWTLDVDKLVK